MPFKQLDMYRDTAGLALCIALWDMRATEITARFGISFIELDQSDGLGLFLGAAIETQEKTRFGLMDHLHAPVHGTEIYTHERSTSWATDLEHFLSALGIRKEELSWINPLIQKPPELKP